MELEIDVPIVVFDAEANGTNPSSIAPTVRKREFKNEIGQSQPIFAYGVFSKEPHL
jgi:hypothetical protein